MCNYSTPKGTSRSDTTVPSHSVPSWCGTTRRRFLIRSDVSLMASKLHRQSCYPLNAEAEKRARNLFPRDGHAARKGEPRNRSGSEDSLFVPFVCGTTEVDIDLDFLSSAMRITYLFIQSRYVHMIWSFNIESHVAVLSSFTLHVIAYGKCELVPVWIWK